MGREGALSGTNCERTRHKYLEAAISHRACVRARAASRRRRITRHNSLQHAALLSVLRTHIILQTERPCGGQAPARFITDIRLTNYIEQKWPCIRNTIANYVDAAVDSAQIERLCPLPHLISKVEV